MVKIQFELDFETNKNIRLIMAKNNFNDKRETVKKILKKYFIQNPI